MHKILVTGGRGFIGSHLLKRLGPALVVDLATGNDLRDPLVLEEIAGFDPEIVFHLAAVHHVPWCREHPRETIQTNVRALQGLLTVLAAGRLRRFVFASSAAVYGFGERGFSETDPPAPVDVYGMTKWIGEELLAGFSGIRPDVTCVAARLFNVVGPGDATEHLLPRIATAARNGGRVTLGNLSPRRDYIHVEDAARALIDLASSPPGFTVRNVGAGVGTSVADVVKAFGALGYPVHAESEPALRRAQDGDLVAERAYPGLRRSLEDAIRNVMA